MEITYTAEATPALFHQSDAFYRGLMGPVRSGKSTCCSIEIMRRCNEQAAGPDKLRRSRWAVVRNTYRELEDTTLKTWLMWFPESVFGLFNRRTMTHNIKINDIDTEVLFRALDRPDDVSKLLSMELTGAWINEAREIPKAIVDVLGDRVGQYPPLMLGGCTWRGIMMDTNPPDDDHWWYRLAEEERPVGWEFFKQPGGLIEREGEFVLNPDAENIKNLQEGREYYLTRVPGKKKDYIRVYYCAQYGYVQEGKPVHEEYVDAVHCSDVEPTEGLKCIIGLDFGLTPAAAFLQQQSNGRWICFDEITTEHMGIKRFGELLLKPKVLGEYKDFKFEIYGDPSGSSESETDERTCYQILDTIGIKAESAIYNDPDIRRGALEGPLTRLIDGKPGFLLSPKCKVIRKGLAGGFSYKRVQVAGDERYHDKPDKNKYSHPVEALEYGLVGAGEGEAQIVGKNIVLFHLPTGDRSPRAVNDSSWMVQ